MNILENALAFCLFFLRINISRAGWTSLVRIILGIAIEPEKKERINSILNPVFD